MAQQMQKANVPAPAVTPGTIYVGGMELCFDVSGDTVLRYSSGTSATFIPDRNDPALWVLASALGYGRQVGVLVRDRVLMHALLAHIGGTEPVYLLEGMRLGESRIDALICALHHGLNIGECSDEEDQALLMAATLVFGGGYDA